MDDRNILAVTNLKSFHPKNIGDIRQLLDLVSYHRRHIQDFSRIAKPISDLLLVKGKTKGKGETKGKGVSSKTENNLNSYS